MNGLIIFRDDQKAFDQAAFLALLQGLEGVLNIRTNGPAGDLVSADFASRGDRVMVELRESLEAVVIDSSSPAGYQFAWQIQKASDLPLRMVDEAYTFDLMLSDFGSSEELEEAIQLGEA